MEPITCVLFDFHTTLVDGGDPHEWLSAAAAGAGEPLPEDADEVARFLDNIWEHAVEVDPKSQRDLSPAEHRRVFDDLVGRAAHELGFQLSDHLVDALYDVMPAQWHPYADAIPVLASLHDAGIATGLVSNVGPDITQLVADLGLGQYLDTIVLSCREGTVKPDPKIFATALERLNQPAASALMVGDSQTADAGAVSAGVRTLLLPRTRGSVRGLNAACLLAGVPEPSLALSDDESAP